VEADKRKFKRFDAFMDVQFRAQNTKSENETGLSRDLSREGIRVSTNRMLNVGILVNLEIHLPNEAAAVHSTGRVMWSRPGENKELSYDSGLHFVLMDPAEKFRVLDYAYNFWRETIEGVS